MGDKPLLLLETELDALVWYLCPQVWFVPGGVLYFLGAHSCEKVVVVVVSQHLVSFLSMISWCTL
jgi:hypothetical protein